METISRALALFLSRLHQANSHWRMQTDFRLLPGNYEHDDHIAVWPIRYPSVPASRSMLRPSVVGVNVNIIAGPMAVHVFFHYPTESGDLEVLPPYKQVAAKIRARIQQGELKPGDAIPSIREIQRTEGVSTTTARQVVIALRAGGYVASIPKVGTYVTNPFWGDHD